MDNASFVVRLHDHDLEDYSVASHRRLNHFRETLDDYTKGVLVGTMLEMEEVINEAEDRAVR